MSQSRYNKKKVASKKDQPVAKAINWPAAFREEVINEPCDELKCALRLGRLYYDNHYWVDGEPVVVRVNHKVIRRAVIVGELKCCLIQELTAQDFAALKPGLNSVEHIVQFLSQTYDKPVTAETEVTVVYYKNQPIDPEILEVEDDPHMG